MKYRHLSIITLVFSLLVFFASAQGDQKLALSAEQGVIDSGKKIFVGNCAQCHAVHKKVVGPALKNVYERKDLAWLVNFIKYPQKVIDSGDEYAVALYKEYKQYMPNHDFLSDEEILSILSYVKADTDAGPPVEIAEASGGGTAQTASANEGLLMSVIIGLSIILIALIAIALSLLGMLTKTIKVKQKDTLTQEDLEYIEQRFSVRKFVSSSGFLGIVGFAFIAVAARASLSGIFTIGVQQGYAPDQPIAFSHKLHAGHYEIECKYCHTGVEKAKSANIPSLNICMNCHNAIKTTSPEIQKIYTHLENDEPVQWVRVHNLPDLAYFNHAQHVKVGGLECETCHGDIKNMEVVQQHSLLTMGWCIDCHRKTEVKARGNDYYTKLVKFHKENGKDVLHVEDIGGLECSKCHY